jgi:hypothetical protein
VRMSTATNSSDTAASTNHSSITPSNIGSVPAFQVAAPQSILFGVRKIDF